ncbi:MAG: tetratricopeptide repeat protein [Melioribacteraceae bacterium]|nr:tetratricopeptide repeat protein [Melioribacteraceae bacterium]
MKKLLLLIILFSSILDAQNETNFFNEGNKLFKEKQFNKAIEKYGEILKLNKGNATVYYNLGNSYFRIGQLGYSVLFYEKALKIDPNFEDAEFNLAVVKARTIDKINPIPKLFLFEWWEGIINIFDVNGWLIVLSVLFALFLIALFNYLRGRRIETQKISFFSSSLLFALLIFFGLVVVGRINFNERNIRGVVVVNMVSAKYAPDEKSSDAFILHEGADFKIEDKIDNWYKIRLTDGKIGWIERKALEVI